MPVTLAAIAPSLIASGASLAGSVFNNQQQRSTNQKNEAFAREMYEREQKDSLARYHMQNEYNSPTSQMARLRQAGLNPNLVYGSGATTTAANLPTPSAPNFKADAPQLDVNPTINTYFDTQLKTAQYDNLKAQNTLLINQAAEQAANIAGKGIQNARNQFDLDQAVRLKDISADTAYEQLRALQVGTGINLDNNERLNIMNRQNVMESVEKILSMREQRANTVAERDRIKISTQSMLQTIDTQKLDNALRRNGINPNDPIPYRVLGRILAEILPPSVYDFIPDQFKK